MLCRYIAKHRGWLARFAVATVSSGTKVSAALRMRYKNIISTRAARSSVDEENIGRREASRSCHGGELGNERTRQADQSPGHAAVTAASDVHVSGAPPQPRGHSAASCVKKVARGRTGSCNFPTAMQKFPTGDYGRSKFQFCPQIPPEYPHIIPKISIFGRVFSDGLKFGWGGTIAHPPCVSE